MRRFVLIILLAVICKCGIYAQQGYWFQNQFIELKSESDKSLQYYAQIVDEGISKVEAPAIIKKQLKCDDAAPISNRGFMVKVKERITDKGSFSTKASKRPVGTKVYLSDIYHTNNSDFVIVLPSIVFEMMDGCSASEILKKYDASVSLKSVEGNVYELDCKTLSSKEVLDIVSQIYQEKGVKWCEPVKMSNWQTCNPKYSKQYYLNNTGQNGGKRGIDINVVSAWSLVPVSARANIKVAVLDTGVDLNHEDMRNIILSGYTVGNLTGYGKPQNVNSLDNKGHGTACAGIIAAEDNSKGIKGVATGVKLLPVNIVPYATYKDSYGRIIQGFGSDKEIADAIVWASSRADVLSCSWGGGSSSQLIVNAINTARTSGRNGKGCVVVFAAGNSGANTVNFPASTSGVLAVGAVNNKGNIWNYSQRGSALSLVAPSGDGNSSSDIVTTDMSGSQGYQTSGDYNYTEHFSGTSAACPQVAGAAALMLAINPNLTEAQVRTKLQQTARDLGSSGFDTTYGYGLVNTYSAVYGVAARRITGPHLVNSSGTYSIENLQSGATVQWALSDSYYNQNCLRQNYPSQNKCTITRAQSYEMTDATLTATIKYNGTTIQTLTMTGINAYNDFKGHYSSGNLSGNINYTHIFTVKSNEYTEITSPNLYGATVSYDPTATVPNYWTFIPEEGYLRFFVPKRTDVSYVVPVVLNVHDGCGNDYQLYAMPSSSYYVNVHTSDHSVDVALDGDEESKSMSQSWSVEVLNASTGEVKTKQVETTSSISVPTAGWSKGVYVIKVTVGKDVITKKIVLK